MSLLASFLINLAAQAMEAALGRKQTAICHHSLSTTLAEPWEIARNNIYAGTAP